MHLFKCRFIEVSVVAPENSSPRLFRCSSCNHKVRFGAKRCGYCYQDTFFLNRKGTWYAISAKVLLVLVLYFS